MSRQTGKEISDVDHIRQSLADILTTPVGSRVMRRTYGSRLFELIGRPVEKIDYYTAIHEAVDLWEPRVDLLAVAISESPTAVAAVADGEVEVQLSGRLKISGEPFTFTLRLDQ